MVHLRPQLFDASFIPPPSKYFCNGILEASINDPKQSPWSNLHVYELPNQKLHLKISDCAAPGVEMEIGLCASTPICSTTSCPHPIRVQGKHGQTMVIPATVPDLLHCLDELHLRDFSATIEIKPLLPSPQDVAILVNQGLLQPDRNA